VIDALTAAAAAESAASWRIDDFAALAIGLDAALVTYRLTRDAPGAEPSVSLRSSLWRRRAFVWRLRFHQGTPQPQRMMPPEC
jgi:hypothetical protein